MPIVRSYLRYAPSATFGLVASPRGNALLDWSGRIAIVPALECLLLWDVRRGTLEATLRPPALAAGTADVDSQQHEVACLARSPNGRNIAAGHADGAVRIWLLHTAPTVAPRAALISATCTVTLSGHSTAVTALHYGSGEGALLVSGGADSDVIVWDTVAETGLYRLKGHRDAVTGAWLLVRRNLLVTCSKDTLVKVWDLTTQHCIQTIVGHRTEVWSVLGMPDESRLITGADRELRVWDAPPVAAAATTTTPPPPPPISDDTQSVAFSLAGTVARQSGERVVMMHFDPARRLLFCHGNDRAVEVFRVRSADELAAKLKRRTKRARAKHADAAPQLTMSDEIALLYVLPASSTIRSFDIAPAGTAAAARDLRMLLSLHDNAIEMHDIHLHASPVDSSRVARIDVPGHRSGVRAVAFSSDEQLLASVSSETLKVWNYRTQSCLRTLECGYGLSCVFVPGDRHVLVGTKSGSIGLYDIVAGTCLQLEAAHQAAVWSLVMYPDKRGFVSGSADHDVKFWDFELIPERDGSEQVTERPRRSRAAHAPADAPATTKLSRLGFVAERTLKMTEGVLCVALSQNQRLLAVSLLDATVKVFFADTLKFFLSLYGHKLPVLCIDISSDCTLLATGSADKNVKLWGLDFGDCHKSIFAHQDSVMAVKFVPNTHYFFTAGKDREVRYWDGDHFERITGFRDHHAEVLALAVSASGYAVCSAGQDRSIRVYERTDEQLFLEEEREREHERTMEQELATTIEKPPATDDEVAPAGRRTGETIGDVERLCDALDLVDTIRAELTAHEQTARSAATVPAAAPKPHPALVAAGNIHHDRYVLRVVSQISAANLDEVLLSLPLSYATRMLHEADRWLAASWEVELACRCVLFLLRLHHNQIVSGTTARLPVLRSLRERARGRAAELRDIMGYNLAALRYFQREHSAQQVTLFDGRIVDGSEAVEMGGRRGKTHKKRSVRKTAPAP